MLLLHSVAHLLVDALCAATLFGPVVHAGADYFTMALLYNTLAFSTQCLVGLAADRIRRHRMSAALAMLTVVLGFALPLPSVLRVVLIGLGNSVFHVAAGADVLEHSRGKAGPLGVFVAPGAIGLSLGILWPDFGRLFAVLLVLAAALTWILPMHLAEPEAPRQEMLPSGGTSSMPMMLCLLLTLAVAVRALGGSAVAFPWKTGIWMTLALTGCVFLGKACGGLLCDRIGAAKTALLSLPLSAVLIAFCAALAVPSLIGQFLLNLTMPVTLWLLYKWMPDQPGFAFGLAASALWPGTIAGTLLLQAGGLRPVLVLLCFLFGLLAILLSYHNRKEKLPDE